jgi:hypothetical protein
MDIVSIERNKVAELVHTLKQSNTVFYVEFIKKTTGEVRKMKCRGGVTKGLSGGELAFDPKSKGLIGVFDMEKPDGDKSYRFINVEGVLAISGQGKKYVVEV